MRAARCSAAAATSASKSVLSSPPPDARARRPRTFGLDPRRPRACRRRRAQTREAVAEPLEALVVVRLDGGASTDDRRPAACPRAPRRRARRTCRASSRCTSSPRRSGRCCSMSPPRATFSTCEPRQIASTGMSRSSARAHQLELEVVALAHDARCLGVRLGAVELRIEIRAAREDEPVDRIERLVDPRTRGNEQRRAAGLLDRLARRTRESGPPADASTTTRPRVRYVVMPMTGLRHQPRSKNRSRS